MLTYLFCVVYSAKLNQGEVMSRIKKFFFLVILFIILFGIFVYFGGGTAVKYVGNEIVAAGKYMEDLETQMKDYI